MRGPSLAFLIFVWLASSTLAYGTTPPRPQATVEWRDDRVAWEFTLLIALKRVRQALREAGCQQVVLVVLTPTLTDDRRIRVEGFCADEWD